uniref:MFS transporter n=1 Tax=Burkholderia arboris TaxID=488730 RepID=UPI003BEF2D05
MLFKIRGLRWWIAGLLTLGTITNYLARSSLSIAAPTMLPLLHITTADYGWITGAFQIMYTIGAPLTGYLMDRIGLRIGFLICGFGWSLVCFLHGFIDGWIGLFVLRGLLGLVEAAFIPGGMRTAAYWFPSHERATAIGVLNLGAASATIIAPPLVAWAILSYSWKMAFVIIGGIGFVWVVLWSLFYRHPNTHWALTSEEAKYIDASQGATQSAKEDRPSIGAILRERNFWGIALPRFCADPVWGTLVFWMPLYLSQARGFDLKTIALTAWLPFVAADIGCMVGGPMSSLLKRRFNISIINGKRFVFTTAAILMCGMASVGFVENPITAVLLLCLGGFAHQTLSVTIISMSADLFPRSYVGTATGLAGFVAGTGTFLFMLTMGWLVGKIGYTPFFIALGLGDLIGAAILWTVVKPQNTEAIESRVARVT